MTVLEKKLEKAQPAPSKINGLGAEPVCSKDRWSAISGICLVILAPLLFPLAVLAGATLAAGRPIGGWLERGRMPPGGGGGGGARGLAARGLGLPTKNSPKNFWRFPTLEAFLSDIVQIAYTPPGPVVNSFMLSDAFFRGLMGSSD